MRSFICLIVVISSLNIAVAHAQNNIWFDAIFDGNLENVKSLIDTGANIEAIDNDGKTALMLASLRGHTEIAKLLVSKGAGVNIKDPAGDSALLRASLNGNTELVEFLIANGAKNNRRDWNRSTLPRALSGAHN